MKRVVIVENLKSSSSEEERDDEKYSYKKKSKGRRNSVLPSGASQKSSSTKKTKSKHAESISTDSSDSLSEVAGNDKDAKRDAKYLNSFMDEDHEDVFQEYITKTPNKCWASFRSIIENIITNPTYHKIFLLLVVVDTALVYTELLIGMMAENLKTCDCFGELGSSACNDWCDTTTKNVSLTSIQNINEPLFPDFLSDSAPPPQDTIDTSQCCKYQHLLQTWIRMGYTTFGLLSLFFIETIVKLAALPHLLSRKMEIADAMLVILSWIMCFIIVFSLEETDCNASEPSEGGLNGMKGVVMLTFRMLRIFNGLAMLFANFFEGKILRYQEKIKFQTQQLNQSQEEKKRLATTAQKILRDKQNLQLQLQAVTMSYNQTQQNNGPPRGPPGGGVGFAQPSGILALPTIHSPIQGGHTSDEDIENLIEHEITAAESALASQSTRVTEINDTEVHHATPSSSFLPPIAQGNAPALIITPPTQETLDFPEDQTQHRNTNPFDS